MEAFGAAETRAGGFVWAPTPAGYVAGNKPVSISASGSSLILPFIVAMPIVRDLAGRSGLAPGNCTVSRVVSPPETASRCASSLLCRFRIHCLINVYKRVDSESEYRVVFAPLLVMTILRGELPVVLHRHSVRSECAAKNSTEVDRLVPHERTAAPDPEEETLPVKTFWED